MRLLACSALASLLLTGIATAQTNPPTAPAADAARFAIPANAPSGPQTVSVTFPGPPGQGPVTFSLANAVTIP